MRVINREGSYTMQRIVCCALLATLAAAQNGSHNPRKGAKDLFLDASSTALVYVPPPPATKAKARQPPQKLPGRFGIHYRIELLKDDGEIVPVPATRPFRASERIRLQVTSNVTGRLTILQQINDGPFQPLFPGASTRPEESAVRAHAPVLIPRRGFRFDNNPGSITLAVRVDPETLYLPVAAGDSDSGAGERVVPPPPPLEETQLLAQRGSKGLVLEEDGADNYCVQPVQQDEPVRALVTTIKLQHVR